MYLINIPIYTKYIHGSKWMVYMTNYKLSGLVHSSFNLYFRDMTEYWIHQSPNKIVSLKLHLLMYFIMDVKTFFFWVCIPVRKYILLDVLICRIKMCFPLWYAESYHDDFPTNHFVNTDMEKQKEWFSGYSHHLFVITYILWITFTFANLVDFVFETVPFGHFLPLVMYHLEKLSLPLAFEGLFGKKTLPKKLLLIVVSPTPITQSSFYSDSYSGCGTMPHPSSLGNMPLHCAYSSPLYYNVSRQPVACFLCNPILAFLLLLLQLLLGGDKEKNVVLYLRWLMVIIIIVKK